MSLRTSGVGLATNGPRPAMNSRRVSAVTGTAGELVAEESFVELAGIRKWDIRLREDFDAGRGFVARRIVDGGLAL
ncbi:hypothetical protein BJF85_18820 [Saccharomonospora sp. CUA-673]|uniref:hypothetical protein n=1 Tax=Saccharomonospora sp. CUA-673 TaxID=1904969 RepID=UPI00095C817C|nr:hypothetical protein [Saccharomonospora sp. CUA-673]OLT45430.1 hypothetical protein BJF85_18820 [Saccharomonospora sp. CUA-673]